MSSLLGGSKRCLHKLLLSNPNNSLTNQFSKSYRNSPLHYTNLKHSSPLRSANFSYCSSSSSSSSSSKNGVVGWYLRILGSHPICTKSVSSALIYTFADLSSQAVTGVSTDAFDFVRTTRMAGYGLLVMGPSLHFWFNFVSKILPKRDVLSTFKKLFLGQAVFGPIMTTIFFSVNAGLQGENGAEIVARLKRDLVPTLFSGLMYWPLCDFITFKFIPVRLQPLVSNSFAYLWTIYITYMATLEKADSTSSSSISASGSAT
ncbi:hypothetical protein ACHQM5_015711 [Ranunculus cassubicifolius]